MIIRAIGHLLVLLILFPNSLFAQQQDQNKEKVLEAVKNGKPPTIDGLLDDTTWSKAVTVSDFYQYQPYNKREPSFPTEVKIIYDDQAIYIGARMYDPNPDSIYRELGNRDFSGLARTRGLSSLNADLFSVLLNPFNDGVNMLEFTVSASNVQSDIKHIGRRTDAAWDAVWCTATSISDSGWVAEIQIPYSSLRFPNQVKENWGLHLFRHIRRYREWDTWKYLDVKQQGIVNQAGEMSGIHDINPPLRLSLTPYLSGYVEKHPDLGSWTSNIRGGMDLKYGINESFTLDMTLIPDFGQVETEDRVLNLSPYEVRYQEKRPFFTEGTELFNKGNIFYSRRIGGEPSAIGRAEEEADSTQVVAENPTETRMINATKISGRTDNGLGIGFLNALTNEAQAILRDTLTGDKEKVTTQPFTNYNMVVLDQSLKNNSYVSLANTNVHHFKGNYTSNVTATEFKLANKENSYQLTGSGAITQKYSDKNHFGHAYHLELSRTTGNFRFELAQDVETDSYDPNDMGYDRRNNQFRQQMELEYNIYEPFGPFLSWYNNIDLEYSQLYNPRKYQSMEARMFSMANFRNHSNLGLFVNWEPESHDYFEPRVDGWDWKYKRPRRTSSRFWYSTDNSKNLSLRLEGSYSKSAKYGKQRYGFEVSPNIRFSDRFSVNYDFGYDMSLNDIGYVDDGVNGNGDVAVTFGKRDVKTITNSLRSSYKFSSRDLLNLRIRHYWRTVDYSNFYPLQQEGDLGPALGHDTFGGDKNLSYNALTIYLQYLWHFSPGSELSVVWKNNIFTSTRDIPGNYFNNLDRTLKSDHINSLSVKFIYYLDYRYLKRGFGMFMN
ncbi:MAG: carbohydrate binding family 9 domain-containing protein [Bacteroidales bacterium]|nr:carbohydrate binding family 9 domain-containing protein [Bacteroidales bacterium]